MRLPRHLSGCFSTNFMIKFSKTDQPMQPMDSKTLVQRANAPAVATDSQDRLLEVNSACRDLLGWEDGEVDGRRFHELAEIRDGSGNRLTGAAFPILEILACGEGIREFELILRAKGGQQQLAKVSVVVVLEANGREYELVYLLQPILRRRRADAVIDQLLQSAEPEADAGLPGWWNERHAADQKLTRRQVQVLRQLVRGQSTEEIAEALGTSVSTVRSHIQNLYDRLDVHNRAQAVAWGLRHMIL